MHAIPVRSCGDEAERVKPKKTYAKLRVGRWPAFFEYKDARVYGFDFLMRAEPDRIYACLACASGFAVEKVSIIWNAARGHFNESQIEAHLRSILSSSTFCFRQMHADLVLTDGSEGCREECPEERHSVMLILSRLIRELIRERLREPGYVWGYEAGLGWADLTDELRRILFAQGSEDIHELTLAEDLGL